MAIKPRKRVVRDGSGAYVSLVGHNLRAEGYRLRAVEIWAIAELIQSSENKQRMLEIADDYERMADQIERAGLFQGQLKPE